MIKLFRKKDKKIHKQIALKIPRGFREMTLEEKATHYPIQDRMPQEAFINDEQAIIGMRHTKDYFTPDQLEDYKQNALDAVFNTPNISNYQSDIITAKKASYILATYTLRTDESVFVMNLVTSHKDMMLLVGFSCGEKNEELWKIVMKEVFGNIKIESN